MRRSSALRSLPGRRKGPRPPFVGRTPRRQPSPAASPLRSRASGDRAGRAPAGAGTKDSGTASNVPGVYDTRPTEAVAQYSILAGIVVRQPPQLAVRKADDPGSDRA